MQVRIAFRRDEAGAGGPGKVCRRAAAAFLAAGLTLVAPGMAWAATTDAMEKVSRAFDPLIDLAQALSFPLLCLVWAMSGWLMMVGYRAKALQYFRGGAVGFVMVQLVPAFGKLVIFVATLIREAFAAAISGLQP